MGLRQVYWTPKSSILLRFHSILYNCINLQILLIIAKCYIWDFSRNLIIQNFNIFLWISVSMFLFSTISTFFYVSLYIFYLFKMCIDTHICMCLSYYEWSMDFFPFWVSFTHIVYWVIPSPPFFFSCFILSFLPDWSLSFIKTIWS